MKFFKNYARVKVLKKLVKFRLKYGPRFDEDSRDPAVITGYLGYLADLGLLEFAENDAKEVIGLLEVWLLKSFEGCEKRVPDFKPDNFTLDGRCLFVANMTIHPGYKEIGLTKKFRELVKLKYSGRGIELAGWKNYGTERLRIYKVDGG